MRRHCYTPILFEPMVCENLPWFQVLPIHLQGSLARSTTLFFHRWPEFFHTTTRKSDVLLVNKLTHYPRPYASKYPSFQWLGRFVYLIPTSRWQHHCY